MEDGLDRVLTRSRDLGFLGPGPIEGQRRHAEAFLPLIGAEVRHAVDLGCGGGVPGLVLAVHLPGVHWTLLDASHRRTDFLREAVVELDLEDRVEVRTARAEEVGRDLQVRGRADLVVARGFGPPAVTAECAAPLLRNDGHLLVSEPPDSTGDRWAADPLATLGLVLEMQQPGPPALVRLRQAGPCPDRFPRRSGVPNKRPLWRG